MLRLRVFFSHLWLPHYSRTWNQVFFIVAAVCLLLPLPFHFRHDYASFTAHWVHLLQGGDPWLYSSGVITGNAYGPLYNLFGYLFGLYSHLPHLIFILAWLAASRYTLNQISTTASEGEKKFWFCFLLLNPLFLATVVSYGHFDITVAALAVLAWVWIQKEREGRAGIAAGLAILLKLYPLVLIPFWFLALHRLRWRFLISCLLTVMFGFGLAFLIWGQSVFVPFHYAVDRQSSMLSIFRFLRSDRSPTSNLDFIAPYLLISTLTLVGLIHLIRRKDELFASIVGLYFTFWFYRVGHQQFYTLLFFLIPLWIAHEQSMGRKVSPATKRALIAPLVFVSFSMLLYVLTQGYKFQWVWVDEVISIPFFLVQVICYPLLVRDELRND